MDEVNKWFKEKFCTPLRFVCIIMYFFAYVVK